MIPRWGGISVRNLPPGDLEFYHFDLDHLKETIEIFVSQLRTLLGIRPTTLDLQKDAKITVAESPLQGITLWELDRLYRERTVRNMLDTVSTLNSLATLISNLENMIVRDRIQIKVLEALDYLEKVCFFIKEIYNTGPEILCPKRYPRSVFFCSTRHCVFRICVFRQDNGLSPLLS